MERSANTTPKDVALYMESGADCVIGKDVLCSVMGRAASGCSPKCVPPLSSPI